MVRFHTGLGFLRSVEVELEVEVCEEGTAAGEIVGGFGGDEGASGAVIVAEDILGIVVGRLEGKDSLVGLFDSEFEFELNLGGLCRLFGGDVEIF